MYLEHYPHGLTISESNGILQAEWNETTFIHNGFGSDADGVQDNATDSTNAR